MRNDLTMMFYVKAVVPPLEVDLTRNLYILSLKFGIYIILIFI